jgi:hypothetical protein
MVPAADDELTRLAYLLGAPGPAADADLETFVRAWLTDPRPAAGEELADPEADAFRRGLGALTPRQRAAAVLRFWSGLPVARVAAVLEAPEDTVELESDAALDVLATDEERLTAGLALLAEYRPVDERAPERRRWRSAGIAAGALVAAGVFAGVLGLGDQAGAPGAVETLPPASPSMRPLPEPTALDPAPSFDNRARRLTAQLEAARARVLAGIPEIGPAAVVSADGREVQWAPLVFHVSAETPDLYLALATLGSGRDAATLKLDVGFRNPDAEPRFNPCPDFQETCDQRRFADGTVGSVTVFDEPTSNQTINRLTIMRPDGTFIHASIFYREPRPDPPPLGAEQLYTFATVFTY